MFQATIFLKYVGGLKFGFRSKTFFRLLVSNKLFLKSFEKSLNRKTYNWEVGNTSNKNEIDIIQSMDFLFFSYNFVKYNIKIHSVNKYVEN